jgi:hypothetical protein
MSIPQITFTATIPPKDGQPEDAGAKSHQFDATNEELAKELCLAMGWRFDGKAQPLEPTVEPLAGESWKQRPRRKSAAKPQTTSNPPLSRKQIQAMAITARQAFDHLEAYDLVEETGKTKTERFTNFRANVCHRITGKRSFQELRNDDFRPLRAEFLALAGKPFDEPTSLVTGKQSRAPKDTIENREQLIDRLVRLLKDHQESGHENAGTIGAAYVMTVAKRKNPKNTLSDFESLITLPALALEQLCHTIKNRIAAKEGRGKTRNRNRKQKGDQ